MLETKLSVQLKAAGAGYDNPLLDTDSYKASHYLQYPPGTTHVYSYIESRGGEYDRTVLFGLQGFLKKYMSAPITMTQVITAEMVWKAHGLPFNRAGFERIVKVHGGYWPVQIRALPEGSVVPTGVPLVTVVNTDPELPWVTSFLETALLRAVWYPTTVATNSFICKTYIKKAFDDTSDRPELIDFKLHDFGARGASSKETAAIGGAAHLVNFMGTDTMVAIPWLFDYYNVTEMPAFSIPAAEHSTITTWQKANESAAYQNMLKQFGGEGKLLAVVSDSYDIWNAVDNIWGDTLRQAVIDSGSTVVIRPDSGDPLTVPVEVVHRVAQKYGAETNSKGYRTLPSSVAVIQGDGITRHSLPIILRNLKAKGYAIDNIAFGMGGGLLQQVNRDTFKFAMKASSAQIDGKWVDVFKSPVGDVTKASKRGQFAVVHIKGKWRTMPREGNQWQDELAIVWQDGDLFRDESFDQIRERAAEAL